MPVEIQDPLDFEDDPLALEEPVANADAQFAPGTVAGNSTGNLADVQATPTWYPENTVDVRFDGDLGVDVQFGCAPGDPLNGTPSVPGRVVKIHTGKVTKVIEWTFERLNTWPVCPHPETGNPNEVLTHWTIVPAKPLEQPDGERVFRISGRYEYVLIRGLAGGLTLPTATSPESNAAMADNTVPQILFDRSLLASVGYQGDG